MQSENKENAVRIWDVVPEADYFEELDEYPLYELLEGNNVKENAGTKRKRDVILFYNVTDASDKFKAEHADVIRELNVQNIKPLFRGKKNNQEAKVSAVKITGLLPLSGNVYSSLTREETAKLGNDFYSLTSSEDGIQIKPVLYVNGHMPSDLYIRIATDKLDTELADKIAPELIELSTKENGLYEVKSEMQTEQKGLN
jgi:hypothetical protein